MFKPIPRVRCLPPQQSAGLLLRVEFQQQTTCTGNDHTPPPPPHVYCLQSCVLGFAYLLLFLIGMACMSTDALGKPVRFIADTILLMFDSYYSNEDFLDHMYRIVSGSLSLSASD